MALPHPSASCQILVNSDGTRLLRTSCLEQPRVTIVLREAELPPTRTGIASAPSPAFGKDFTPDAGSFNALTVDVEDYFQASAFTEVVP